MAIITTLPFQNHDQIIMTNSLQIMDGPLPIELGGSDQFWGGVTGSGGAPNVLSAGPIGGGLTKTGGAAMTYIIGVSGSSRRDAAVAKSQFGNTDSLGGSVSAIGFAFTYTDGQSGVAGGAAAPAPGSARTRVVTLSTGQTNLGALHCTLYTTITSQFTGSLLFSDGSHLTYAIPNWGDVTLGTVTLSAISYTASHGPVFDGASDPFTRRQVHMGYR